MTILTPEQAAQRLQIPVRSVMRMCRLGQLPGARKAGRCWRNPESAFAAFFGTPAPAQVSERVDRDEAGEPKREPARVEATPQRPAQSGKQGRAAFLRVVRQRLDRTSHVSAIARGQRTDILRGGIERAKAHAAGEKTPKRKGAK